jgi:hypothetical protein
MVYAQRGMSGAFSWGLFPLLVKVFVRHETRMDRIFALHDGATKKLRKSKI